MTEMLDFEDLQNQLGEQGAYRFLHNKLKKGFKVNLQIARDNPTDSPQNGSQISELSSVIEESVPHLPDTMNKNANQTVVSKNKKNKQKEVSTLQIVDSNIPVPLAQDAKVDSLNSSHFDDLFSVEKEKGHEKKQADFRQMIISNSLYQQLQEAYRDFENGNAQKSLPAIKSVYLQATSHLYGSKADKLQQKIYIIICVQCQVVQAQVEKALGQFQEAVKHLESCLKQFQIYDIGLLGQIYMDLGNILSLELKITQSINYYYEALLIYEKMNWKTQIAACLKNLAYLYAIMLNHEGAKDLCLEALYIYKTVLPEDDERIADVYFTFAQIFYMHKEYELGLEYLHQALTLRKQKYGEKHKSLVDLFNLTGVIYLFKGDSKNATINFELAFASFNHTSELKHAQVLNNLGLAYFARNKPRKAVAYLEQGLKVAQQFYKENHPLLLKIHKNLTLISQRAKNKKNTTIAFQQNREYNEGELIENVDIPQEQ